MSNKKQTAVDWLFDRMVGLTEDYDDGKINYITYINGVNHFLDQAKEMEKQQIIDFANNYGFDVCGYDYERAEQYYKQTYEDRD